MTYTEVFTQIRSDHTAGYLVKKRKRQEGVRRAPRADTTPESAHKELKQLKLITAISPHLDCPQRHHQHQDHHARPPPPHHPRPHPPLPLQLHRAEHPPRRLRIPLHHGNNLLPVDPSHASLHLLAAVRKYFFFAASFCVACDGLFGVLVFCSVYWRDSGGEVGWGVGF